MNTVKLPNGRVTTRLGFGCGPLHGGLQSRQSRRIIDIAFEAGFRHFDVAPSYGLGLAETVLGTALLKRRQDVTITTKAGIPRPQNPLLLSTLRSVVKPLLASLPGWKRASKAAREITIPIGSFDARSIEASLIDSLRRMQTTFADIFLMHEMRPGNATPELLEVLLAHQKTGTIGAIGTGTSRADALAIAGQTPALGAVQQYRWNVCEPPLEPTASLTITHGAIVPALQTMIELFTTKPALRAEWSAALDLDLAEPTILGDLLLGAALSENPKGLVLVHSHNAARIRRFAAVAEDNHWQAKGAQLAALVAQQGHPVL